MRETTTKRAAGLLLEELGEVDEISAKIVPEYLDFPDDTVTVTAFENVIIFHKTEQKSSRLAPHFLTSEVDKVVSRGGGGVGE